MERKDRLQILSQRILKGYGRIVRQHLDHALGKVKKASIAKMVKNLKSNIEPSFSEEPMISSRRNSMYDTIRPLDNNYASIQIINNSGFDKNIESSTISKIMNVEEKRIGYENKDFL